MLRLHFHQPAVAVAFSLVAASHVAALDLTPRPGVRKLEQFQIPVILFEDGARTVRWQPPTGWQVNAVGRAVTFFPPKSAVAMARLEVRPPGAVQATPATAPLAWAQTHLPNTATEITLTAEHDNPFALGGQSAKERIYTYRVGQQRLTTSIAYVDLNARESLALLITALTPDFDAIRAEAIASMFSWNWVDGEKS